MNSNTTPTTTPAPVEILELINRHYGEPNPGTQETELAAAIARLVALAAQHRAQRDLWAHEQTFWQRLRDAPAQKGAH